MNFKYMLLAGIISSGHVGAFAQIATKSPNTKELGDSQLECYLSSLGSDETISNLYPNYEESSIKSLENYQGTNFKHKSFIELIFDALKKQQPYIINIDNSLSSSNTRSNEANPLTNSFPKIVESKVVEGKFGSGRPKKIKPENKKPYSKYAARNYSGPIKGPQYAGATAIEKLLKTQKIRGQKGSYYIKKGFYIAGNKRGKTMPKKTPKTHYINNHRIRNQRLNPILYV